MSRTMVGLSVVILLVLVLTTTFLLVSYEQRSRPLQEETVKKIEMPKPVLDAQGRPMKYSNAYGRPVVRKPGENPSFILPVPMHTDNQKQTETPSGGAPNWMAPHDQAEDLPQQNRLFDDHAQPTNDARAPVVLPKSTVPDAVTKTPQE